MNLRRQATARKLSDLPGKDVPRLVGPRVPRSLTAVETTGGSPLKMRPAIIPVLAALPEYADLSDKELVEMARQKTYGRLHVSDRWAAIALLLGTRDVLPARMK